MSDSSRISPTALYTGHVWTRNGLSHPELATAEGRWLFEALRPINMVSGAFGGPSLEPYLLARHRTIDRHLREAIDQHGVSQVIEVACGLSPRGWRFVSEYGSALVYVEADLPGMAARKRGALQRIGSLSADHRVVALDALRERGPGSLSELSGSLDHRRGLAIITEGLLSYLEPDAMGALWGRVATMLTRFSSGRYIADLHLAASPRFDVQAFMAALSLFVRGRVHLHFAGAEEARGALLESGFDAAEVSRADYAEGRGGGLVHILEASTVSSKPPSTTIPPARGGTPPTRRCG
ncbi:MAG: class I SAM-dependent methyltransferase [Solirubrobacteraceae bacterium]